MIIKFYVIVLKNLLWWRFFPYGEGIRMQFATLLLACECHKRRPRNYARELKLEMKSYTNTFDQRGTVVNFLSYSGGGSSPTVRLDLRRRWAFSCRFYIYTISVPYLSVRIKLGNIVFSQIRNVFFVNELHTKKFLRYYPRNF